MRAPNNNDPIALRSIDDTFHEVDEFDRAKRVLERSPIPTVILDATRTPWWCNANGRKIFEGLAERGFGGQCSPFQDARLLGPELRGCYDALFENGRSFTFEMPWYPKHTEALGVDVHGQERVIRVSAAPIYRDRDEAIVGAVVHLQDISDERHVIKRHLSSEARLRSYLSSIQDAMWCYEPSPLISLDQPLEQQFRQILSAGLVDCNERYAQLLGVSIEEALGQPLHIHIVGEGIAGQSKRLYTRLIEQGGQIVNQMLINKQSDRVLNTTIQAVIQDRWLVRIWGTITDITEQRHAEEERARLELHLQQRQRLESVGALAGGVAHDFNNALLAIMGNAELALDDLRHGTLSPRSAESVTECLQDIIRAASSAAELTQRLLAFGRRQAVHRRPTDVPKLLVGIERMLCRLLPASIELVLVVEDGVDSCELDPTQFEQVIVNLCVNARDAMDGVGWIEIRASHEQIGPEDQLVLKVSDNGPGIPADIRNRIFEPFFTTKGIGDGTGLGLSIVYGIVRAHGGSIDVTSDETGSAFEIHVPVHPLEADDVSRPLALVGAEPRSGTILVAEDEPLVRSVAQRLLERAGFTVELVENGAQAVAIFAMNPYGYELALVDAVMPTMNGKEVFHRLREIRPDMPIVFCTGYSEGVLDQHLRATVPVVSKPFGADELLSAIDRALEQSPNLVKHSAC